MTLTLSELHELTSASLNIRVPEDGSDMPMCNIEQQIDIAGDDLTAEQIEAARSVIELLQAASRVIFVADHLFHATFDCR